MNPKDFTQARWAELVPITNGLVACVPKSLPPQLEPDWRILSRIAAAERALAELAGTGRNLPNPHLLIGPFLRREAVLSSRIEGTQASLSDLYLFEASGGEQGVLFRPVPNDTREVANYVRALEYGLMRLGDLPLSLRLIREIHGVLMEGVRGEERTPGEFRRIQNWIGPEGSPITEATYIPPPVPQMNEALDRFERFLHATSDYPYLVRLAMAHYQFEAIHPFIDGNGRVGRLLIALLPCHDGLLPQPLLYLSAYFEQHRQDYYRHLLAVSREGAWRAWIEFFLEGVTEQARDAAWRAGRLLELRQEMRVRIQSPRASALLPQLVDGLFATPYITIAEAARRLNVTFRSASKLVQRLWDLHILYEISGRKRNRVFVAGDIITAIEQPRPKT